MEQEWGRTNIPEVEESSRDGVGSPAISARAWRLRGPVRRSWPPRRPEVDIALAEAS